MSEGWAKTELYLQDLKAGTPPVRSPTARSSSMPANSSMASSTSPTNEDAPRYRVFVADAAKPARANWKEIDSAKRCRAAGCGVFGGKLFAQYEKNASSRLSVFGSTAKCETRCRIAGDRNRVWHLAASGTARKCSSDSSRSPFPPSIYRYDLSDGKSDLWAKVDAPSIDPNRLRGEQVWSTSKDGTKVPMFIVCTRRAWQRRQQSHAADRLRRLQHQPDAGSSAARAYLWLEHGGVYAVANLRGGGEFGEDWHRAGMLEKKQNVFDDFIAAGEYLIAQRVHRPRSSGDSGRLERRPADGRGDHAAAGSVPRRGVPGAAARHAALSELPDRQALDPRVRLVGRSEAVRLALRLFALPSREGGHGVSGDPLHDRRYATRASIPCTRRRWRR